MNVFNYILLLQVLCGDASNRILKNVTIEQAPRVLILQLKRFRYDKRENKTMKVI